MKIYFNCHTSGYSYCRGKEEHDDYTIKRYVANSPPLSFQLIEICDYHWNKREALGWRNMSTACITGCNHTRCQEVYNQ